MRVTIALLRECLCLQINEYQTRFIDCKKTTWQPQYNDFLQPKFEWDVVQPEICGKQLKKNLSK